MMTRRQALLTSLFGTGCVGLRALATGLPVSLLLDPRKALADNPAPVCADKSKAQFVIFNTSFLGDPLNAGAPGTYEDAKIFHCPSDDMKPVSLRLGSTNTTAAGPWGKLSQNVLDRTSVWHTMTDNPIHPKEPQVLSLMGATKGGEMLPSILAKYLAPCLGTLQPEPLSIGAVNPTEALRSNGAVLPIVPPLALKATLTAGPLASLQNIRNSSLDKLYDVYRTGANAAQKAYIDSLVISRGQLKNLEVDLLSNLESLSAETDPVQAQLTSALTLFQMNVAPVIAVHLPFGGDNHHDANLQNESVQTTATFATLAAFWQGLPASLADRVSLVSLNVFGRTLGPKSFNGRQHNKNHQVSLAIGKPFKGGIVGGVGPVADDYGALGIESSSGKGVSGGDIMPVDTLGSFARTLLTAFGVDSASVAAEITAGKVVSSALA